MLIVLMRKPVAFMLSAKTMLRVFAANNHSKSLFQVAEECVSFFTKIRPSHFCFLSIAFRILS